MQRPRGNLYQAIGPLRFVRIVWSATPFPARIVAWPYGAFVYRRMLRASRDLDELRSAHEQSYLVSPLFRVLRPRYTKVRQMLIDRGAGAPDRTAGAQE